MATTAQKNIPALRFSKFKGEWEEKKLETLIESLDAGVSVNSEDRIPVGEENSILKTSAISNGFFYTGERKAVIDANEIKRLKEPLLNNAIVISRMNTPLLVGANAYIKEAPAKTYLPDRLWQVKTYKKVVNTGFLALHLSSEKGLNKLRDLATGTSNSMKNITKGAVLDLSFLFPSLGEQQKIASFLFSVDERLQQLQQQQSLLEQYKKGGVQQFFSQKLRFKDNKGKAYPNWKEKALGDIYTQLPTNSYSRENLNYISGKIKNIHYGDIHSKFKTLFDIQNEEVPYINADITSTKNFSNQLCKEGDLVIADASEDTLDVGKCIELINLNNEKVVAGLHTILIRPSVKEVSIGFGGYLLASPSVKKNIAKIAQGTKVYSISARRLLELKVSIPSLEEQTKIANFLSAIDEQINTVKQQIAQTQQFKKGLLQQMFV